MAILPQSYIDKAQNLYKTTLGREGDTEGVNYWANEFAQGKSQDEVNNAFKTSAKLVYNNFLTNPNDKYSQDQNIRNILTQDLQSQSGIGKSTGTAQSVAQKNLTPDIYKNLYGADPKNDTTNNTTNTTNTTNNQLVTGLLNAPIITPSNQAALPSVVGYAPQTVKSNGYTATKIESSPESSSQDQLNKILSSDSPLMKQGETTGLQMANKRGLLNSTMAVGAAQNEMIRNATPLAQQDANTRANIDTFNATAANRAGEFNANLESQMAQFNANASNQAAAFEASSKNQSNLQALQNQSQERITQFNANAQMELSKLNANNQLTLAEKNAESNRILADKEGLIRKELQSIQIASQSELESVKNNNEQLLRTNALASTLMQQVMTNIANIQSSSNLGEIAKNQAITTQINTFKSSLDALGEVSKLDLGKYFNQVQDLANQAKLDAEKKQNERVNYRKEKIEP